jgi:hypothetical protein
MRPKQYLGKLQQARELLFDTRDLKEAKALLEELVSSR